MDKLKLMTIVGTRPEIIRLSETIKACDVYFNHILVHTGQNWDDSLNDVFFREFGLRKPDYNIGAVGKHLGETIGNIISGSYELLSKEKPDGLLILGDTNSSLCSISAKRLKIPIFHMEAGNRCFDQNVPEEINRKIVDHISDINMPYTEHSRRYLLSEGIRKEHIFVTGSPMPEVLFNNMEKIEKSRVLEELGLEEKKYMLLSAHREENIDDDDTFSSLMEAMNFIADTYKVPVIYSTHPRSWKKIDKMGFKFHKLVRKLKPFGFFDYNKLQMNSHCVLSDSGTLSEESAILGFCGVLIRTSTEHPEVLDKGTIVMGGTNSKDIKQAIDLAVSIKEENRSLPLDYADRNVSAKVVKIIQSYAKIVDMVIWDK